MLFIHVGVKLGLLHLGTHRGWGCSWIACWGGYLRLGGGGSDRVMEKIIWWQDSWFVQLSKFCLWNEVKKKRWDGIKEERTGFGSEYLKKRDHFEYWWVEEGIILKRILKKQVWREWTVGLDISGSWRRQVACCCVYGNEPSVSL